MTPEQKLKLAILFRAASWKEITLPTEVDVHNVDELYDTHNADCGLQDAIEAVRHDGFPTDLADSTPWFRGADDFEKESVAMKLADGTWVGWTRWYGGGKHAEPASIPWMEYSYNVICEEKQVTEVQRFFAKL